MGILTLSYCSFSQTKPTTGTERKFNYRVGIMSSVPVDIYGDDYRVGLASSLLEASYKNVKFSKKISLIFNTGYIRMSSKVSEEYAQIPIMVGARYPINDVFYFGTSAGVTFYNKKEFGGQNFIYSPYIGFQIKHLSVDLRYLNTVKKESSLKTLGMTFSYTL